MFVNPYINTFSSGKSETFFHIDYASSFPNKSQEKNIQNNSFSKDSIKNLKEKKKKRFSYKYTIALDWLQFVCIPKDGLLNLNEFQHPELLIDKILVHHNHNFYSCYRVYFNGLELCEVYMHSTTGNYKENEVLVKVLNHILYMNNWNEKVEKVLKALGLSIVRYNLLDIAVDGASIIKIMDLCRRYNRNHTIQINNNALAIEPKDFDKETLSWRRYIIGSRSSSKFSKVYNKSDEIQRSGKWYISHFWLENGLDETEIYRFEIRLRWDTLKKYPHLNLALLSNAEILSELFQKEVREWLEFRYVKLEYLKKHRKEIAFRKGKERPLFKWDNLPKNIDLLRSVPTVPRLRNAAKRSITFQLGKVRENPAATTTLDYVKVVDNTAKDYDLVDWTKQKINDIFWKNGIDPLPIFSGSTSFT